MKKNKAYYEQKFMDEIMSVGVKSVAEMYERGHYYYCFFLIDGSQHYWTNMSKSNLETIRESIKKNWWVGNRYET